MAGAGKKKKGMDKSRTFDPDAALQAAEGSEQLEAAAALEEPTGTGLESRSSWTRGFRVDSGFRVRIPYHQDGG